MKHAPLFLIMVCRIRLPLADITESAYSPALESEQIVKIKLILAADVHDPLRKNDPFMPLSLPLLAACAPGHDYTLVDMLWEDDVRVDERVDLVGISVRQTAESLAYTLADKFRERGIPVVLGGAQISMAPYRAAAHANAVVVGEAEMLWPQVVKDVQAGAVKQFYVCSPKPFDGQGQEVFQQTDFPDLQSLPVPRRDLYKKKYVFDTVFAARGCPVDCDFCCVTSLFGSRQRLRPIDDVVAEIASFKRYYYLLDDTVFGRPATYDYYLNLYDAVCAKTKRRYWTGQANLNAAADSKGREVIRRAVDSGLLYAAVGIESINPQSLEASGAIRKAGARGAGDILDRMRGNIRFIQNQGVLVSGWFVIGYDNDTVDEYYRILEFCREMHIVPAIFPVNPIDGTRLYHRLDREGRLDSSRLNGIHHEGMTDAEVLTALQVVFDKGFSIPAVLRRTAYLLPHFSSDRIHRTIFSMVTQFKLKGGIDLYRSSILSS